MPKMHGPHNKSYPGKRLDKQAAKKVFSRLWKYLEKSKLTLLFIFLLVIVSTASNLLGSYLIRPIINNYILPGDIPGLLVALLGMLLVFLVGVGATYLQNTLMVKISQRTVYNMRTDLFAKMQTLPIRYFDTHAHGDLMSRLTNDMDNVSNSLNTAISQLFSSAITLVGTLALMVVISPLLTLITVVIMPLLMFLIGKITRKSRKYFGEQQRSLGEVNGYIEEIIGGQKVVKVFSREEKTKQTFASLNEDLRKNSTLAQIFSGIMMPLMQNINTINYAFTAVMGGVLSVANRLDIGGLGAFLQYCRQFSRPLNEIANQFNTLQSALAGAERMFDTMDELPEPADRPNAVALEEVRGEVVLDHVTFSYVPKKVILKDISLYAKPGQKIAFVGSTGAGKTTITNLLTRFYDIQQGHIYIDGVDIMDIKMESLRKSFGMVLQDTHLFTGTVMENIRYGNPSANDDECKVAARLASADAFIRHLPQGYDTMLTQDGANLSQGQRQLLNIARTAIADPPILILDEATSSIDTRTERLVEQGMDRIMEGRTTFVIAHRLSTVRNADCIMVIEQGEIIERGSHEDLLEQKGRYYQLYTGQFELE